MAMASGHLDDEMTGCVLVPGTHSYILRTGEMTRQNVSLATFITAEYTYQHQIKKLSV
jgi:hypothetical protein